MTMQTSPLSIGEAAPATRGAWGFTLRDDGRAALTYADQFVAIARYRSSEEQARVHALYAHLTRDGRRGAR